MKKSFLYTLLLGITLLGCSKSDPVPAIDYSVKNQRVMQLANDFEEILVTRLEIENIKLQKLSTGTIQTFNYSYNYKPAAKFFANAADLDDWRFYAATSVNGDYVPVTGQTRFEVNANDELVLILDLKGQLFKGVITDDSENLTKIAGQPTDEKIRFTPVGVNLSAVGTSGDHMALINALNRNNFNGETRPLLPIPADLKVLDFTALSLYIYEE